MCADHAGTARRSRGYVDDPAPAPFPHPRQHRLHAQERGFQVHRHGVIELIFGQIFQSTHDRDAGIDGATIPDARPDAPPDAQTHAELTVSIESKGRVTMIGIGTCDQAAPQNGQCTFLVKFGSLVTASAQGHPDYHFDKWTTSVCSSTSLSTCTFTFNAATPLGVKFRKDD